MDEAFFSCVLLDDGSGNPALAKQRATIEPGIAFHLKDSSEKVYLAGGFPSFTPQSTFSLSPTFQLNCDLGNLSDSELQLIAQAELNRLNASTYRSYTREVDTRVAVLANDSSLLNDFLETYGGVVHAEPLLLKGYDADYPTIDNLQVEQGENGYRLLYTVRTPIDDEKCAYCGLCGPACPEDCLSEDLFLDLSNCSYCKKCIEVCTHDAIDLYRAEKRSLDIPAVILLGVKNIELPRDRSRIFSEDSLDSFFATLIPIQVDETVSCNPYICQYISRLDAGCQECVDVCPRNAVLKTKAGISLKHELCSECGSCISSCPTGSMQYELFDDHRFVEWFKNIPIPSNCTVIIGNEKQLHALWWKRGLPGDVNFLFLEYPNISALTSMHLLFLLSLGAGKIILLGEPDSMASHPVAREIQCTNTVFSSLFGQNESVSVTTGLNLAELLKKTYTNPLSEVYHDFSFTNRREKLGSVLRYLIDQDAATADLIADLTGQGFQSFGAVICDADKCTHCGACLNECRMNALTTDEDTLSLNLLGINCIQCSICVEVCPEDALGLKQGLQLHSSFLKPRELTRAEAVICPECGKAFGTRKSFDRVIAKLQGHRSMNTGNNFFEYCDKCRVVKLFESQQQ